MDARTWTIMIFGVVALVVIVGVAWVYLGRRRRIRLRERFGPEYDRAVRDAGEPARAEAVLADRERRIERLRIRSLSRDQAESFSQAWKQVQARFVDDPGEAIGEADKLLVQVMAARGYPIEDFDQRAADLSVDHSRVVDDYRIARAIAARHERGEAGTEELRQAVLHYRSLFDDVLQVEPARRRAS